jgi:signal transduction histidine kinase
MPSIRPGVWAGSVSEGGREGLVSRPWRLHPAHAGLALLGLLLIGMLAWSLAAVPVVKDLSTHHTQAERCIEHVGMAGYRAAPLAQMLSRPIEVPSACWQVASLPETVARGPSLPINHDTPLDRIWFRVRHVPQVGEGRVEPLMVYVPRVMGGAWQLQVNGAVVADNLADWRMMWNRPIGVSLPPALVTPGQPIDIVLGIVFRPEVGYGMAPMTVGPQSAVAPRLAQRLLLQDTLPQASSVVLLLMGMFFMGFWWTRRQESAHLLVALASLAWFVCNLQYVLVRPDDEVLNAWYAGIVNVSITWVIWLIYLFGLRFDARRFVWVERGLALFVAFMSVVALPVWQVAFDADSGVLFQLLNVSVAAGVTVLLTVLAVRRGGIELRVIVLALWLTVLAGVHDVALLAQRVSIESVYLLPYGAFLLFASFLMALQRRYVGAIDQVETVNDQLELRLAERQAELQAQHERLREVERAQALLLERQRLMRDMHDGLGSSLMSSLVMVEQGQMSLGEVGLMLRECVDDLRLVVDSLEPIEHDLILLLASLRHRLGRRLEAAGLVLSWQVQDLPALPWLEPPDALHILRFVQEVLTNVLKHAGARQVLFRVGMEGPEVHILIRDDGCGMPPQVPGRGGRGLLNLRERARRLGGRVKVSSCQEGPGVEVSLWLPLQRDACPPTRDADLEPFG